MTDAKVVIYLQNETLPDLSKTKGRKEEESTNQLCDYKRFVRTTDDIELRS